uniref:Putative secreted protein n=1 Tax=Anopheles darlingi TaxID=43151 RepID=A0A2M4DKE5_ANODA
MFIHLVLFLSLSIYLPRVAYISGGQIMQQKNARSQLSCKSPDEAADGPNIGFGGCGLADKIPFALILFKGKKK